MGPFGFKAMNLHSKLFSGNQRLESCAVSDPSHVTNGDHGLHVFLIQQAVRVLDAADIARAELDSLRTASRPPMRFLPNKSGASSIFYGPKPITSSAR